MYDAWISGVLITNFCSDLCFDANILSAFKLYELGCIYSDTWLILI